MKILELKKEDNYMRTRHLLARLNEDGTVYEYVVCSNYNGSEWDFGHYFKNITEAVMYFEMYPQINPHRLSEIASLCVEGLIEDDYDSAMEYFRDAIEMTEEECEYFDIDYDDMMSEEDDEI